MARKIAWISGMVLAIAAIAGALISWSTGHYASEQKAAPLLPVKTSGNGWQRRLAKAGHTELEAYGALRSLSESLGKPEEMPTGVVSDIARNLRGVTALHLQFTAAHRVLTPSGTPLWIVDGRGVTCIFREAIPASACDTRIHVLRQGIFVETYQMVGVPDPHPTSYWVQGVVPDGVDSIRARIGANVIDRPVRRSIYEMHAKSPIDIVVRPARPPHNRDKVRRPVVSSRIDLLLHRRPRR